MDTETAEAIVNRYGGQTGTIEEEKKTLKQIAPQLYDLTTLQSPFTAKNTLSIAQSLYERHKMITYQNRPCDTSEGLYWKCLKLPH